MCPDSSSLVRRTADDQSPDRDDTPEYPLSAPIKPDDPERRTEHSQAETDGRTPKAVSYSAE